MEKKKNWFNLSVCLLLLLVLAFCAAALGTYGTTKMPSSYYQVEQWEDGNYDAVVVKLELNKNADGKERLTKSIWFKLGGYDYSALNSNISIKVLSSSDSNSSYTSSYGGGDKTKMQSAANLSNFVKLAEMTSTSTSRLYYEFIFKNIVKVEEIVFVDEDNKVIPATIKYAGPTDKVSGDLGSTLTSDQYAYRVKEANKLLDEQKYFDASYIDNEVYKAENYKSFTEQEIITLESVRNILSGSGRYVDGTVNAFGLQLISLGVAIFGGNTFGLRIVPFIFSVATIILMFYVGKLLFGKDSLGLLLAFLYAVGGFALSSATLGSVTSIFVFFTVFAFYGMFKFYKNGINSKNKFKSLAPLIISGIMFSFSLATKMQALYSLLALAVLFALTMLRTVKANKARNAKLDPENIQAISQNNYICKRKISLSLVCFLGLFILLGILWLALTFVFSLSAYQNAHSGMNIGAFIAYVFGGLTRVNQGSFTAHNASNIFSYLLNFQAEKLSDYKFFSGNIVIAVMALFSTIYATSYVLSVVLSRGEEKHSKEFKKEVLTPYILLGTAFIVNLLLSLINANKGLSEFSLTSVFYYAMIVLSFSLLSKNDTKVLFNVKSLSVNTTKIVTAVCLVFAVVVLGFAIPRILGIPVNQYYFNILAIKW